LSVIELADGITLCLIDRLPITSLHFTPVLGCPRVTAKRINGLARLFGWLML